VALSKRMARAAFALCAAFLAVVLGASAHAQTVRNGGGDFDWEIGSWNTVVRVRAPLDPSAAWTDFRGTSVIQAMQDGRANYVGLDVSSGERRIEGISLRLYNPQTAQWSLNFASMRDGLLTAPVYGGFANGRGVFYGTDNVDGRVVLVRFVISDITRTSARFVQSYSADAGATWIDNWIATDTRR
jgi:hypothetical protein